MHTHAYKRKGDSWHAVDDIVPLFAILDLNIQAINCMICAVSYHTCETA